MRALKDYGALLLSAAAATPGGDDGYAWQQYDYCAAQSELTCNGGGAAAVPAPSRKRGREEDELLHYAPLLPLPGMMRPPGAASTSGRAEISADHALASELLCAEVDALVRAECDRLRAGLELARKRQHQALLVRATVSGLAVARRVREAEAQLEAAQWRMVELKQRVRLAATKAQAWCSVAWGQ